MAIRPEDVRYGRIIYTWIEDHRGYGKLRPALVLTRDELLQTGAELIVAAITTTFPKPPPRNHVELPWHPRGIAATRLTARSAVVLNWPVTGS